MKAAKLMTPTNRLPSRWLIQLSGARDRTRGLSCSRVATLDSRPRRPWLARSLVAEQLPNAIADLAVLGKVTDLTSRSRARNRNGDDFLDPTRTITDDHNTVAQGDGLVDAVSDEDDRLPGLLHDL